jgi:primosomal protein N' (replication factor Y)
VGNDVSENLFALVALSIPIDKSFHYRVPEEHRDRIAVGKRVLVPFGPSQRVGYCVGLASESDVKEPKEIIRVLDDEPIVDDQMLRLTRWIADYYCCSWGEALDAVLPRAVKEQAQLSTARFIALAVAKEEAERHRAELEKSAPKQAQVLTELAKLSAPIPLAQLVEMTGCSDSAIKSLAKRGLVSITRQKARLDPLLDLPVAKTQPLRLNAAQAEAMRHILAKIQAGGFGVVLVRGVTGSGKTELYLQAVQQVVSSGKQAIVLVPEISLTPQTVARFRARFDHVALLHSQLSEGERNAQWRSIRSGQAQVVIGPQSAVFAPTPRLGMIVVDEEHDHTFKQQSAPRYHARDLAIVRAQLLGIPVVLGSATPSLESYLNTQTGKYDLVELPERIGGLPLPPVHIVDMRNEKWQGSSQPLLSHTLEHVASDALKRGEQVIFFLNRRGFATYVHCRRCGFVLKCMRCHVPMTFYKGGGTVLCHHCNQRQAAPQNCPSCAVPGIRFSGIGTERIEEELRRKFREFALARMDSDTMRGRGAHHRTLDAFKRGDVKILLGTQMIAKGLDFPGVTLVGVISADTALHLPDFRSAERTFQLIAQVAGRAGRGERGGQVIVQTHNPDHYAVQAGARHDYKAFADHELEHREKRVIPPIRALSGSFFKAPKRQR